MTCPAENVHDLFTAFHSVSLSRWEQGFTRCASISRARPGRPQGGTPQEETLRALVAGIPRAFDGVIARGESLPRSGARRATTTV
jgi:hypothetical protein